MGGLHGAGHNGVFEEPTASLHSETTQRVASILPSDTASNEQPEVADSGRAVNQSTTSERCCRELERASSQVRDHDMVCQQGLTGHTLTAEK